MRVQSSQRAPKLLDSEWQRGRQTKAGMQADRNQESERIATKQKGKAWQAGDPTIGCHILMCVTQRQKAYGNDRVRIWWKKIRNHRSVNTNIERKMKDAGLGKWRTRNCRSDMLISDNSVYGGGGLG